MLYLIDSAVFIQDPDFNFSLHDSYAMTALCFDELKSMETKLKAENALQQKLLSLQDPSSHAIQEMHAFLASIHDSKLSEADISLLALAREFSAKGETFQVITDDYSIQNACKLLNIPFQGLLFKEITKGKHFKK